MSKLELMENTTTRWEGLWYHPESYLFTSRVFSLETFRGFSGSVRLYVRKNRHYNGGENRRPNYHFWLRSTDTEDAEGLELLPYMRKARPKYHYESNAVRWSEYYTCGSCDKFLYDPTDQDAEDYKFCPYCGCTLDKEDCM